MGTWVIHNKTAGALVGALGAIAALFLWRVGRQVLRAIRYWRYELRLARSREKLYGSRYIAACIHSNVIPLNLGSPDRPMMVHKCVRCWGIRGIMGPDGKIPDGLENWKPDSSKPPKLS